MKALVSIVLALGLMAGIAGQASAFQNDNTPKHGKNFWKQVDRNTG